MWFLHQFGSEKMSAKRFYDCLPTFFTANSSSRSWSPKYAFINPIRHKTVHGEILSNVVDWSLDWHRFKRLPSTQFFKFYVLGHKVKLFKAFQSSPIFFCLPAELKSHGFCGLCRSAINVSTVGVFRANGGRILLTNFSVAFLSSTLGSFTSTFPQAVWTTRFLW